MGWKKKTKLLMPSSVKKCTSASVERRLHLRRRTTVDGGGEGEDGLQYRPIPTSAAATAARRHTMPEERSATNNNNSSSALILPQSQQPQNQDRSFSSPPATTSSTTSLSSDSSIRKVVSTRESFEIKHNALVLQQFLSLDRLNPIRSEERLLYYDNQNVWIRLAAKVSPPETSQKELIHRSTFIIISTMTVVAGIVWSLMYVALGEYLAALMPAIYSIVMGLILVICILGGGARTTSTPTTFNTIATFAGSGGGGAEIGYYDYLATAQLVMILLLPFAVHVALGGVEKSGGVMLWSFLCPMGAAFFRNSAESLRYFWLYLGISVVLLSIDYGEEELGLPAMNQVPTNAGLCLDGRGGGTNSSSSSSTSSFGTVQHLYFLMNIIGVKCVIFAAVFLFARELEKEYTKSEDVLTNILPRSIVKRIKQGELPIVDHVPDVSILFADLVGFTKASTELHPNFLIGLFLRDIFQEFDELAYKHGLEKIKTIGDAYMVVGGLNHGERLSLQSYSQSAEYQSQKPEATNIMLFAVDMFKALRDVNKKYGLSFELRVGTHTGPVVAGVLGLKRFAYDVWGDTVNIASRMESNGVPGLIHLSSDMYESVGNMTNIFDFTCCGMRNIKGKGMMTTYLARYLDCAEDGTLEKKS
ncbi:hypothetical protein ACHAWU_003026 [Discostella pseudostelligera]|uniref:adenylate cyclase n=1 Tax=Discostella pseudostelligera TaxID=259834 RepID=A0ABD3MEG2_9STRA